MRLCLGEKTLWRSDSSSLEAMSGNPFAVNRIPGGKLGKEWNFAEDRVRKIA